MAVVIKEPPKKPKKIGFFFKISLIFLVLGIMLHFFEQMFWSELSYFTCCVIIMLGAVYSILHRVMYFTGKKVEHVITVLFYTGLACLILLPVAALIFKEEYYVDISPFMEIHTIIILCLSIGLFLLPVSIILMIFKFGKLFKFFSRF